MNRGQWNVIMGPCNVIIGPWNVNRGRCNVIMGPLNVNRGCGLLIGVRGL